MFRSKVSFFFFFAVANNELPPPALRVPQLDNGNRLSVGTRERSPRHRSKRRSRIERTMSKVDNPNASKIDETLTENDIEPSGSEINDEPTTQDELLGLSGDCSIM